MVDHAEKDVCRGVWFFVGHFVISFREMTVRPRVKIRNRRRIGKAKHRLPLRLSACKIAARDKFAKQPTELTLRKLSEIIENSEKGAEVPRILTGNDERLQSEFAASLMRNTIPRFRWVFRVPKDVRYRMRSVFGNTLAIMSADRAGELM